MQNLVQAGACLGKSSRPSATSEVHVLCQWLALRPHIAARVQDVCQAAEPLWRSAGFWLELDVVRNLPLAAHGHQLQTGFHGTSMHVLHRMFAQGPMEGWDCIGQGTANAAVGIYMHKPPCVDLCEGYCLYSPLRRSGWYWCPVVEFEYPLQDPFHRKHVARSSGASSQFITYSDVVGIRRVYLHLVHIASYVRGPKSEWINIEPFMDPRYEVDHEEPFAVLANRSQALAVSLQREHALPA